MSYAVGGQKRTYTVRTLRPTWPATAKEPQ
jgi:hypothetical protein